MSKGEIQAETAAAGTGSKKKRLLVIGGSIAVVAAAGGGAWFVLGASEKAEHAEVEVVAKAPPTFFTLDPFVVNLAGEVQHYVQVGIDLKIADEQVKDQIKAHLPEIRNGVLLLLSSKEAEELASLEGKNRLRAEIREAVNQPLGIHTPAVPDGGSAEASGEQHVPPAKAAAPRAAVAPPQGVLEVFLTSFVIQ